MSAATEPVAPTTPPPKRSRPSLDAVCEWMATDWSPWHVVLSGLTWADYQRLLDARAAADRPGVRITYSFGEAEVVTTGSTHERWKTLLVGLFEVYLEERWGDVVPCGNMTIDRKDLQNGFEPDACYYLHPTPDLLVVRQLDFSTDPPPDLALEVEVSRSVVGRLPIYATFRIPEIWRYDGQAVTVMRLQPDGTYLTVSASAAVPGFPFADLTRYLQMADTVGYLTILRQFRAWVRQTQVPPGSA